MSVVLFNMIRNRQKVKNHPLPPEVKAKQREYQREYRQKPEVKARAKINATIKTDKYFEEWLKKP